MRLNVCAAVFGITACACVPIAQPVPSEAHLTRDRLVVTLSDGQRCAGARPSTAGPEGWSGTLEGCSAEWPYVVRMDLTPNPLRRVAEGVAEALTFSDQLLAMAEVEVAGPDGTAYRFASPPPPTGP